MGLYDADIREPLFGFLDNIYVKNRIIEEKTMGSSRADLMMVLPDSIVGIEIKSDADTYTRLATQVGDYDKYFDRNYCVVGSSHAMHIEEHVPEYWGIITVERVDEGLDFYILRQPGLNPKVTWKKKLEILWRPELAHLQEIFDMPRYRERSKGFVCDKILDRIITGKISEEVFAEEFSNVLFERDYTTITDQVNQYRKDMGRRKKRKKYYRTKK